jgi:tryptophan synthase alpha chain
MKLALYFTFPYPDQKSFDIFFKESLKYKYEYLELGIPTENPYYDGPAIRKTHKKAMEEYSADLLKRTVNEAKKRGLKLYALVYYNHFVEFQDQFLDDLKNFGFSGAIVPDLLTDYFSERYSLIEKMKSHGLSLIPFFTSSTPDKVIEDISLKTTDWIYHGLQPSTGIRVPVSIDMIMERIKTLCPGREIIFGFGINSAEIIDELRKFGADGIAVGSTFISSMENGNMEEFQQQMKMLEVSTHGK